MYVLITVILTVFIFIEFAVQTKLLNSKKQNILFLKTHLQCMITEEGNYEFQARIHH